ncbi:MAG: hypothetical protein F4W98_13515 [Acidimicrobiales bacterium]|nr:hypothetical protein [Acidimicrobiales bacterium]
MGDADADENDFDVDTSPHATVTLSSTTDAVHLKVTTDINENSTNKNTVDIDTTSSVKLTAQLVDGDDNPVAKPGVEVSIKVQQTTTGATPTTDILYPPPAAMKTDDDGRVTYTTSGPKSTEGNTDHDRVDRITFSSNVDGSTDDPPITASTGADTGNGTVPVSNNGETVVATIFWTDSNPTLVTIPAVATQTREAQGKGVGSVDPYALRSGQGKVTIRTSVSFYDQYGNPAGKGHKVTITIGTATEGVDPPDNVSTRTVSSSGTARWARTLDGSPGNPIEPEYNVVNDDGTDNTAARNVDPTSVIPVNHADDDTARGGTNNGGTQITAVYDKENRFLIAASDDFAELYSYDDGDRFFNAIAVGSAGGPDSETDRSLTLEEFEKLIKPATATGSAGSVEVVFYDDDGESIFRVTVAGT